MGILQKCRDALTNLLDVIEYLFCSEFFGQGTAKIMTEVICNGCGELSILYAKGFCHLCYDLKHQRKKNFIFRLGRPLRDNEILHNLKLMYKQHKFWKKKREKKLVVI